MEVKIISEELIKPSSPTPRNLRTFNLCLLDQLVPVPHNPIILFYPASSRPERVDIRWKLDLLKKSLSQTLARFYPLSGKLRNGLYVECDDDGARFVESTVNMSLAEFFADPDLILLNKLIPCEFTLGESGKLTRPANFQVNVFQCGGLALAICDAHKLHDGAAIGVFLKEWTTFAQGGGQGTSSVAARDLMAAAELFPANDLSLGELAITTVGSMVKMGNCATKRFEFSRIAIEALKARGMGCGAKNPTRAEAVSGFLWKCVMAASERKNNGLKRPSAFTHMVNIRKRMDPPLSEFSLGNLLWVAVGKWDNSGPPNADDVLPSLVGELQRAISKVDGNFLLRLSRDKTLCISSLKEITELGSSETVDHVVCSSWCNLGFYDADFGWGKPIWVSNIGLSGPIFLNLIYLVDTRSGDGIEAWVTLDEQEMTLLQDDPELLSFASLNPSPWPISDEQ